METLILDILLEYTGVGLVCAALIDIVIRTTKSSAPFTFSEILGTIVGWPVVVGVVIHSFFTEYFS